jgi:hypothetical protein
MFGTSVRRQVRRQRKRLDRSGLGAPSMLPLRIRKDAFWEIQGVRGDREAWIGRMEVCLGLNFGT